ncbi:MAG TPA: DUF4242 domain-containing protein [Gemmatimonadales bacterium]|jgi:hypothetical protein|nr:DUF4242 domain-containing protein [Gemmatimonadales bacterium]
MPKYLISREVPGIGGMSPDQLRELSAKSNAVLGQLDGRAQWVQSYVTDDHLLCVYNAEDEAAVRDHARIGGFPCDEIRAVGAIIDPVTGE